MKSTVSCLLFTLLALLSASLVQASEWRRIELPSALEVEGADGEERMVYPGCSGGPVSCETDPATGQQFNCQQGDTDFAFYIKSEGNSEMLFYFDGGGACWDSMNCLTATTYNPESANPDMPGSRFQQGVFDQSRADNPFREWTEVYIPYCTGDLHVGSNDQKYIDYTGVLGQVNDEIIIHHRGFDNFLAVLDWVKNNYAQDDDKDSNEGRHGHKRKHKNSHKRDRYRNNNALTKIFVTGSSAGSYGATFNYPWIRQAFPEVRSFLLADAGNAIINEAFTNGALFPKDGSRGPWNVNKNMARWLPGYAQTLNSVSASELATTLFGMTASFYPLDPVAQYTTSWDLVQMGFLNVMENIHDPLSWTDLQPPLICEWNIRAARSMATNEQINFNYNYYKAAGTQHTIMGLDLFYTEQSAGNKVFSEWVSDMLEQPAWQLLNPGSSWQTEQCAGDCGALFDPALCYR